MNKVIAALKSAPKRAATLAVIAAAVLVPAGLFAWGPDRPTYTYEQPADHVTFNSITNNPTHGDERNFVQIREAGVGNYGENVQIQPGKEYEVYVYYHNNASSTLNDAAHNQAGIAKNAQMRVQMPASVKSGEKARVTGVVSADNATPGQVWDEAYGAATSDVALRYVQGSATVHSNGAVNGQKMPDSLLTTGAPLGYDKLDGNLPGCNQYAGYVIFKFKAVQPNFEVTKQVAKNGTTNFAKSMTVNAGDTIDYKIQYKNTGDTQQNDVVIKDMLPKGVSYVPGSTQVATSATGGQWAKTADDAVVAGGINIGSYAAGGNAYVKFSAKVAGADALECGANKLTNTAEAQTNNGNKQDTADVTVNKECQEQPKPVYTCDALGVSKLTENKFRFETGYTVKNGTFKNVTYVVRDANGKEIARQTVTNGTAWDYTQAAAGKYTVEAVVTFVVDGKEVTAGGGQCKKGFEVVAPAPGKIVVCDLTSKQVIVIDENQFDASKHSKNMEDCKSAQPVAPATPVAPVSPTSPVSPANLPTTGSEDALSTFIGLGAIVATLGYFITARRSLGQ